MSLRRAAVAAGVVAFAAGVLALVAPGALGLQPDRVALSVVGAAALGQAIRVAWRRRGRECARTPDPELVPALPAPGEDLTEELGQFVDLRRIYSRRDRVRRGLRAVAVDALSRYETTRPEAERDVGEGTWTDDPRAAATLADRGSGGGRVSRDWARAAVASLLGRDSAFEHDVRRTVRAIAAVVGVESEDGDAAERSADPGDASADAPAEFGLDEEDLPDGVRDTGHWRGVSVVALAAVGAGAVLGQPAVVLAGTVGVGYAAYAGVVAAPDAELTVERALGGPDNPAPDTPVPVTLTVCNEGPATVPDLRLVDGVPPALRVVDGSPRLGTALRAGETATVEYAVEARRGAHEWEPALALIRDAAGTTERAERPADGTRLVCRPPLRAASVGVPLRQQAGGHAGQTETEEGGRGIEFYATRRYRPGDPIAHVDWKRRARTGELATLEFRRERAATVVVVVDARPAAHVAPTGGGPSAVDRSAEAAIGLFARLLDDGNVVGLAAVGATDCWLPPARGPTHRARGHDLLATHPALAPLPPDEQPNTLQWKQGLRRRLSAGAQVVFVSPLADAYAARLARQIDIYGHPVTVVSPDATAGGSAGRELAQIGRAIRLTDLRRAGIRVVDWEWEEPVDGALARTTAGWST